MKTKKVARGITLFIIIWTIMFTIFIARGHGIGQEQTEIAIRHIYPITNHITLETEINALKYSLQEAREIKSLLSENNYIGEFEVTYYTAGFESTGKNPGDKNYGITASGRKVQTNHTYSSDWSVLPEGTRIYVEGEGFGVIDDSGYDIKGNRLDKYVEKLEDIPSVGRHMAKVYLLGE